jgi:hypothetical protein
MPRGPKPAHPIALTHEQLEQLRHIARLRKAPYDRDLRAKNLVLAWEHSDWTNTAIATKVGANAWTVWKWRKRWRENPDLADAPRPGTPRLFSLSRPGPDHRAGLYPPQRIR